MGWNKQSGDSWVLQRTVDAPDGHTNVKMLQLRVIGLLTVHDAEQLAMALEREVEAARKDDRAARVAGVDPRIDYSPQFGEDEDG